VHGADHDFYDSASGLSDETVVHAGPGRFYLELDTPSDCRWSVRVHGGSAGAGSAPPAAGAGGSSVLRSVPVPRPISEPTLTYDDRLRWTSARARLVDEAPYRTGAFYVAGSLWEVRWAIPGAGARSPAGFTSLSRATGSIER
ncbi:MAG: hypothetical protein AB1609_18820, partial [Bacillota bacterium]